MKKAIYVWKGQYPWDIRAEKICNSLIKNGYEVYLIARWFDGEPERENYKNINIIRAGFQKQFKLSQPISINPIWKNTINNAVQEIKPDIIIPRDIMLAEACGKIGHKFDIPVIMDMAEHYPAAMKGWKKYYDNLSLRILVHYLNIPELVEKRAVNLMDGIITVCTEQNQRLNEQFNFSLYNMQVVHNTPTKDFFKDNTNQKKINGIIFGHHGFTTNEKSIKNFLLGFILAANIDKKIEFLIYGDGESYDELSNIANSSNVNNQIKFKGNYLFNDLPQIINLFDIGVIPYQISDFNNYTIHNKIFDYMASGRPVIVSEATPMKRIINETKAGIVVDCSNPENIADAILNIQNLDLQTMSENGIKAFREKYNWEVDSKNMIDFIERIIK